MKKPILNLNALQQDDPQAKEFVDDLQGRCSASESPEWTKEYAASGGKGQTTPPATA